MLLFFRSIFVLFSIIIFSYPPLLNSLLISLHNNKPVYRLLQQSIRRLAWLSPHPHGRDFFLCGISAVQKDQSFILRVRKYELQVAEPFILCRTLVPIMTAAYYHCSTHEVHMWLNLYHSANPIQTLPQMLCLFVVNRNKPSVYCSTATNPWAQIVLQVFFIRFYRAQL